MNPPVALTIAGTDSGGAAGTAADLATFAALGVHGACVITAVTAQDTTDVSDIHPIPVATLEAQLHAVFDDLPVAAVKTGMLGSAEAVELVARLCAGRPLVVDPVLVATSGAVLGGEDVRRAYLDHLLPVATVVTPNLDEARALLGHDGSPEELAVALAGVRGPTSGRAVIVTGGDPAATGECTDWLAEPGKPAVPISHPAVPTSNDHGTGCTYSSALAAHLARGAPLREAAEQAAAYVTRQLAISQSWTLGRGRGPIAHTIGGTR
ncbi:hydroxymethylpyrimidine kinase /phosphomethylpyrimidine kinase [Nocardioides albertanoniae]|uniref:Hydroxymethylpyrimidine kinase /phosphomethylpyrimidine kinase n=1 Tax=Nocardioides albertanoniae TaxID=1175486 RepID=A0A543ABH7_9ACTN|nr:bifunctional hydroxymethylpyrimidine kinase/phosphomethylpyrimidine kinase [Nocardioides albertanoniae]TQL69826.1 hydroxymethylpyrimidine kinase /phosphomethylpyrimidine kinase [Nocardioides albertanoniae]